MTRQGTRMATNMQAWTTKKVRQLLDDGHLPDVESLAGPVADEIPNSIVQAALPVHIRAAVSKSLNTLGYRRDPESQRAVAEAAAAEEGTSSTAPSHFIPEQEPLPGMLSWLRENIARRDRDYEAERVKVAAWCELHPEAGLTVDSIYEMV
jgi:hypothetical protein